MGKVDQKNKRGDIYKITDAVIHLYLVYMFVIFPLVLHDGYKDITITKYNFFKNGVLALLIIMALLLVLYLTDRSGNTGHPGSNRAVSKKHTILASDVFMVLFLIGWRHSPGNWEEDAVSHFCFSSEQPISAWQ